MVLRSSTIFFVVFVMISRYVLFSIACLSMSACQKQIKPEEALRHEIVETLSAVPGTFALAFKDLQSGTTIFINEDTVFHAASMMKTPVMMEVFRQASLGKFSLGDSIIVYNDFKSIVDESHYSLRREDDSQQGLYELVGKKVTIEYLVYEMIVRSSNLATNIIIDLVTPGEVMSTMKKIGANNLVVRRGVEDQKAFDAGLNNTTTASDLLLLFQELVRAEFIPPASRARMIDILEDQDFNEIIPAHLPQDVRVAHKTGNISGVQHDGGIIILPDGRRYILVILSKELADEVRAVSAMAEVSRKVYDFVTTTR